MESLHKKAFPTKMLGASMIGDEELAELADVIKEKSPFRHYGIGDPSKVKTFEDEAMRFLGTRFTLALSSGSAALSCAVAALGIKPGDEVILPAFGWFSDFNSIVLHGALPVPAPIDESLNLSPQGFKALITENTKAVIVIHYQGGPAKLDEIIDIAQRNGIKVIEDCAQSFGGEYSGKKLGTLGDIAITSFQANKMITCGEGGLLYTDSEEYFIRAVRYHDLGFVRPVFADRIPDKELISDSHSFFGQQYRMSELQGAFILAQLRKIEIILEKCRRYHKIIIDSLQGLGCFELRPRIEGDCGIALFIRFKTSEEAADFSQALIKEGIPLGPSSGCCNICREYPIVSKKMYAQGLPPFGSGYNGSDIQYGSSDISKMTDDILTKYVSIGIGPMYNDEDIEDIVRAIRKVAKELYNE